MRTVLKICSLSTPGVSQLLTDFASFFVDEDTFGRTVDSVSASSPINRVYALRAELSLSFDYAMLLTQLVLLVVCIKNICSALIISPSWWCVFFPLLLPQTTVHILPSSPTFSCSLCSRQSKCNSHSTHFLKTESECDIACIYIILYHAERASGRASERVSE